MGYGIVQVGTRLSVKGQSGTTVGIFTVLAVLVAVAVAGVSISENRRPLPPLEVVIDMPPPAPEPVAARTPELAPELAPEPAPELAGEPAVGDGAPSAPDPRVVAARATEAESAGEGESHPEPEGGDGPRLADAPAEDVQEPENVQEIETAAGSDDFDATPPPDPIAPRVDSRTEDREGGAAPPVETPSGPTASNETVGADVETADGPAAGIDLNSLVATFVEPAMEERQPSMASTYVAPTDDTPAPLGDAVVISRRSNLRSEPGPDSMVLAKLNPGERVFRLDDKPVLGYYRVASEGVVGWIWWLNVSDGPGGNIEG